MRDSLVYLLESYSDEPNILGFLRRCRESKYYRPGPNGSTDEPTTKEIELALEAARSYNRFHPKSGGSK